MQHDFNIANQSFPATRTDLNNALQALASNSSGDAEPSTTFANQWWYETDTNTLKLRNEANNAWLSFATVDQTTGDWTLAHDVDITGTLTSDGLTVAGATSLTGNLTVDGGTIKLDGNYPVGTDNVALGDTALDSNVSGVNNTAVGSKALTANTASDNTAVGTEAAAATTSGTANSIVGKRAFYTNTTGSNNSVLGAFSLFDNTSGGSNTAVGTSALQSNTTASNNTAVGYQAGYTSETSSYNTFLGYQAGYTSNAGAAGLNTCVGYASGYSLTTGTNNLIIGANSSSGAGYYMTTGSKNTILGGYNGNQGGLDIRTSSNNIVLSDGDGNPRVYVDSSGNVLVGTTTLVSPNPGHSFSIGNGSQQAIGHNGALSGTYYSYYSYNGSIIGSITQSGTTSVAYNTSSDYRLKTDAQPMTGASARVQALNPVNFEWIADGTRVDGFLAHEAQEVVPEAVTGEKDAVDADGNPEYQGIDQSKLVPLLTAALQEALTKIDALEARITALENA
jgi:hypothetical protein